MVVVVVGGTVVGKIVNGGFDTEGTEVKGGVAWVVSEAAGVEEVLAPGVELLLTEVVGVVC